MWRPLLEDRGDPAAQGAGSAVAKVSDLCGGGVLPSALPEVRVEGGSGSAVAEQGAVHQGLRRRGGSGVRVRGGPAIGAAGPIPYRERHLRRLLALRAGS